MVQQSRRQPAGDQLQTLGVAHFLPTKLYVPPPRANAVARPSLTGKLLSGVGRSGGFTLVSAPAGFGKTTLLSEFVTRLRQPVAWVSLDDGDNDPTRFWTYLIMACQSILEEVGGAALELLRTTQQLPDETIPALLINDLATQEHSIVAVLDDYHEIQDPAIHSSLLFLLEHLPPNLHVIVSTRIDPPWPLVRYRARNQLVEIRAQDLRFHTAEAADFLNHTMALDLSTEDVVALEVRTEGWIAGLQLAGLSLQGHSDTAAFIQAFTGSHVYIAEYLVEEILQKQPQDVQLFLLRTAILERMNAGLCEAVTGCQDGQGVLTTLHRANIFLVPLDDEGRWFRYHHLFADLLRARLQRQLTPEKVAALHLRAADWYEQHGFVAEAIHHALTAGDFERVASLVDRAGQTMFFVNQNILEKTLNALPVEVFQTHPRLEVYRTLVSLSRGTLDMAEATLLEKERLVKALPSSPEDDRLRLEALVYLCLFMAHQNTSRAIQMAQETLAELPQEDLRLRASLYSALYRAHGMAGDIDKSEPAYRECLHLAQSAGQYNMMSNTTMVRAFDLCQYGRMDEAARYCQLILDVGKQQQQKVFYPAGASYIGLAGIHLERYDLAAAEDCLERGLELCRQGAAYGLYTGYLQQARLLQAKGEFDAALAELQKLERVFQRRDFTLTIRQVSLRLAIGDVASAASLVPPLLEILGGSAYAHQLPLIAEEAYKLCLARICIAQEELERASRVLHEIQPSIMSGKRFGRLLELKLLRALIAQHGQVERISPEAADYVTQALELAEPMGFVLLFLEEGPALIPLLHAVVEQRAVPARIKQYARMVLNAFAGEGDPVTPAQSQGDVPELVESLTPREMEVLLLIA
ncbi:MAG: hypothetical protein JW910_13555, partial [Anaerolineae bacterium]|nr:hypothetical protein [Anaerolineae bacterium]